MFDFRKTIDDARSLERAGDYKSACEVRYTGFRQLYDALPDDEEVNFDWADDEERAAIELVNLSAIDHFLIGDWEMAAAMFETVLDIDPEDHLEATVRLAYSYLALDDTDSFDDIINDVSDKYPDRQVLMLWSEFRRSGTLPEGNLVRFRTRFAPYFKEFTADEHPVDEAYLKDIDSDRPSQEALARELWLQTEPLWTVFPDFIGEMKK